MIPGIERIEHGDCVRAMVIRSSVKPDQTEFLTPGDAPFQLGFICYPEGHKIPPHRHLPVSRALESTSEVLLVRSGRVRVQFYDRDSLEVASTLLEPGDVLLHLQGGHGFEMLEDAVLLELKQGPYAGTMDKEPLFS